MGELLAGDAVEQVFSTPDTRLDAISIMFLTLGRTNIGSLSIEILDGGAVLFQTMLDTSVLQDYAFYQLPVDTALENVSTKPLTLRITSVDGVPGNAVSVFYGNSINTGRAEVAVDVAEHLRYKGAEINGQLCMELVTTQTLWFGAYYWHFVIGAALVLALYCIYLISCEIVERIVWDFA